jgi:hypothetical protein
MIAVIFAKAGIQYAAALAIEALLLWNTGSSAFADDDSCKCGDDTFPAVVVTPPA